MSNSHDAEQRFNEAALSFCEVVRVSNSTRRKLGAVIRRLKKMPTDHATSELVAELQCLALTIKATNEVVHARASAAETLAYDLREASKAHGGTGGGQTTSRINVPLEVREQVKDGMLELAATAVVFDEVTTVAILTCLDSSVGRRGAALLSQAAGNESAPVPVPVRGSGPHLRLVPKESSSPSEGVNKTRGPGSPGTI